MATFNPNGRKAQPAPYPNLFTPPTGREIARSEITPYGAVSVTRAAGAPATTPAPAPAIGATPFQEAPGPTIGSAPFPDVPASNIIEGDFQQPTNYGSEAADHDPLVGLAQREEAAQSAYAAALEGAKKFRADPAAVVPPAVDNAPPMGEMQGPPAPARAGGSTAPKSAFTPGVGFPKEPITFKSPTGEAWQARDAVGFNDAAVEKANPGWTGGSSWTGHSSLSGPYASAGTPDQPHKWATETKQFYDRAADRGDDRRVARATRRGAF